MEAADKESKERVRKLHEASRSKFDELIQRLERYDRWRRSRHSIESATNWMLAINVGTLFLLVGSFGKFIVSGVMPIKPLFLLSALFLGLSAVVLAFSRALLYLRDFGIDKALEDMEGLPDRLELNIERMTKEEAEEMVNRITGRSVRLWRIAHNLIVRIFPLVVSALVLYVLGVLLLATYVALFIVKYV